MKKPGNARGTAKRSNHMKAFALLCVLCVTPITHADEPATMVANPHYTPAGFFDLHVCNWTDRPMFFLAVFSSERSAEVKSVDVIRPDGRPLMGMNLGRYRIVTRKDKPEKHVFIEQLTLPPDATDGWYSARIALHNGEQHFARDYVILHTMAPATGLIPPDGAKDIPVPTALKWDPVPGASHYKVYIQDLWEGALILESKLLSSPRLDLPPGLIKPGGDYIWRVHARDVNENVLLGDFNHGSFTGETRFNTAR